MKIKDVLKQTAEKLKTKNIPTPRLDAEVILMKLIKKDRAFLYTHSDYELEPDITELYESQISERLEYKPVAYINREREFMSLDFYVDENVLIPRPDTEILVEKAISVIKKNGSEKVLDLATGSGAIGLSIKYFMPDVEMTLSDISESALETARLNGRNLGLDCEYILSDLFSDIDSTFDVIVSNPPYIPSEDINKLSKDIKNWEPRLALDGGSNGYLFYELIISQARDYLNDDGILMLESGDHQSQRLVEILKENGYYNIEVFQDYSGIDRVVTGWFSHIH